MRVARYAGAAAAWKIWPDDNDDGDRELLLLPTAFFAFFYSAAHRSRLALCGWLHPAAAFHRADISIFDGKITGWRAGAASVLM